MCNKHNTGIGILFNPRTFWEKNATFLHLDAICPPKVTVQSLLCLYMLVKAFNVIAVGSSISPALKVNCPSLQ